MRAILPPAGNEVIGQLKTTAVVSVISLQDVLFSAQIIYQRTYEVIPLLLVATLWYLLLTSLLSVIQYYVERHFSRSSHRKVKRKAGKASASGAVSTPSISAGETSHVTKRFSGNTILDEISLDIPAGSVTVILGPSGSGKSTLLRCINHLEKLDGGTIRIGGELVGYQQKGQALYELSSRRIAAQRSRTGMVFQQFNLFPHRTVLQNITDAPLRVKKQNREQVLSKARALLRQVGLASREDDWPQQLSGGQQQRVAIARALAMDPEVMLFDEPTSALDPELVGEVLQVIKKLAHSGITMVIVTHEIGFAREVADNVIFMEGGKIVASGPTKSVLDETENVRVRNFLSTVL